MEKRFRFQIAKGPGHICSSDGSQAALPASGKWSSSIQTTLLWFPIRVTFLLMRRRHETEFYARQASILLGNNACRSGNDRSPRLKVFFALSRGRRGTQRALNSVSCLLLKLVETSTRTVETQR